MEQQSENLGNCINPDYYMRIYFCGGWGYRKYALQVKAKVNETYPGKIQFNLFKD